MAIRDLFRREKKSSGEAQAGQYKPAPGTSIRFDPALVSVLKHDHRKLLGTYKEIQDALAAGDFARMKERLASFRTLLQGHLLTENVRLYVYLAHQLQGDETSSQIIRDFRHEMDGIGRTVMAFLRRYSDGLLAPDEVPALKRELEVIGAALASRIRSEEEVLYPLYQPTC
jgi:regulator of sigma D